LNEWDESIANLLKFNSSINVEKQLEADGSLTSVDEKVLKRHKLLKILDSVPVVVAVLVVVVIMMVWTVSLGDSADPPEYVASERSDETYEERSDLINCCRPSLLTVR